MYGLEALTAAYADPVPWAPGSTYTVFSGMWSTVVYFYQPDVADGATQTIGWSTADNSCYLLDLRYLSGSPIAPTYAGGIPGGGGVEWDPDLGAYVWTITNDTGATIQLSKVQFGPYGYDLGYGGLEDTATQGGVAAKRVADIDLDIIALTVKVLDAEEAGDIPGPRARSLLRKLDKAAENKEAGLAAFDAGDVDAAAVYWERASHQMENFVSEVTNQSTKGNVPHPLADELIADARSIIEQLDGLSATQNLSATGVAPVVLKPGESFSFPVPGVGPGDALVLSGVVLDGNGEPVLNWVEQAVIPAADRDTTPPTVSCTLTPNANENGWNSTDVIATLSAADEEGGSGVLGIYWAVDPDDVIYNEQEEEGLEFHFVPAGEQALRFTDEGISEITYFAADNAGNFSEPQTQLVQIDKFAPVIVAATISPDHLWSPDHTLREMTLDVIVTDSNPAGAPTWYIESVTSSQPENGTGDGDEAPDWVVGADGQTLSLRSERAGGGETRWYTVTVRAVDVAGNLSEPWVLAVPVAHDQSG